MSKVTSKSEAIIDFVSKHPNSDGQSIGKATGIAFIHVYSLTNALMKEHKLVVNDKKFSLAAETVDAVIATPATTPAVVKKAVAKKKVIAVAKRKVATKAKDRNFGRSFDKFSFEGKQLRKGMLILAFAAAFLRDKNLTFAEAKKQLPDIKGYPIVDLATAKRLSAKKQRYLIKYPIKTKDGKHACMSNQVSSANFPELQEKYAALGYKASKAK